MRPNRRLLSAVLMVAILLVIPALSAQQAGDASVTIAAYNSAQDCPESKDFCFKLVDGTASSLASSGTVNVTFENRGSTPHEVAFANLSAADPEHDDTDETDAFARIPETSPGETKQRTIQVPQQAQGVYLWCGIPNHERFGMWLKAQPGQGDPDERDDAPLGGELLVVGLVGAALARRRGAS